MSGGRPTKYRAEYAEQAYRLCLLGATDEELAGFFGVAVRTIKNWYDTHPKFLRARKEGKAAADANVADRLYQRAMGYEHEAIKFVAHKGDVIEVPYRKHYPPDTAAAIYWLNNRQRGKWSNRHLYEHTGRDGGPIQVEQMSDEELRTRTEQIRNRLLALQPTGNGNGKR